MANKYDNDINDYIATSVVFAQDIVIDILTNRELFIPLIDPDNLNPDGLGEFGILREFTLDDYYDLTEAFEPDESDSFIQYLLEEMITGEITDDDKWETHYDVYLREINAFIKKMKMSKHTDTDEINDSIFDDESCFVYGKLLRERLFKNDGNENIQIFNKIAKEIDDDVIQEYALYFIDEKKDSYKLSDLKPLTLEKIDSLIDRVETNEELFVSLYTGLTVEKKDMKAVVPQTLIDAVVDYFIVILEVLHIYADEDDTTVVDVAYNRFNYYLSEKPGSEMREAFKRNIENRTPPIAENEQK